ncbi:MULTISPECIES: tripartite tricarboxylate transporter substrate binding protein [unclassified Bordetella]|uniref:Bug family tripartite tricarboxylate transporter substrate binding protein n=1 Tax=unclassified Bordetella TaxID=2630031 RepID=UPI001320C3B1|nr:MULTISPECIES: tripartite tricarboxylate transporter substrate binding protein [unclassified Bordetella]MVW71196.1 tripartite tricarboxylate transporter substrate binding protein [Bordetella sp. 15P40C-2]MVW80765.1 tripartite tricarboxylate transporter substrate binding protein [Bordetella sp. 02P26C-1]
MRIAFKLAGLTAALTLAAAPLAASAAKYPDQPIRLIVGFTAGSTIDTVARIIGDGLSKRMGTTFIVENKTGANGMIAARAVAQAKPDGYTLLVSNSSSITVNPMLFKDLGYDPLKDFEPISTIVSVPFVLVVNPENPSTKDIKSVQDLVKRAKDKPNTVTYGSAGNGNLMHLAGAQLGTMSNTAMTHVPYRGAAPMEAALLGKEIDFGFDTLAGMPLMKSGKLLPLAVSTKERWRDLPDVPSVAETGYPGFDVSFWVGTFAPAGTPKAIVDKLNKEIAAVVQEPAVRDRLMPQGNILTQSPQAFREKIETELKQNGELIKRANITIEQ